MYAITLYNYYLIKLYHFFLAFKIQINKFPLMTKMAPTIRNWDINNQESVKAYAWRLVHELMMGNANQFNENIHNIRWMIN